MNNSFSSPILDEQDDYPTITQADLDRAKFRVGLQPVPPQERVVLFLDKSLLDYCKAQAGESGYRALIHETLRQVVASNG